jgi:hypothetical protein
VGRKHCFEVPTVAAKETAHEQAIGHVEAVRGAGCREAVDQAPRWFLRRYYQDFTTRGGLDETSTISVSRRDELMIKRMIVGATTVLAACLLAGGPASAATPTATPQAGPAVAAALFLSPEPNFQGVPQRVFAPVPFRCTPVALETMPEGAQSAINHTRQTIRLYAEPAEGQAPCEGTPVVDLPPRSAVAAFTEPVFYFKAAL